MSKASIKAPTTVVHTLVGGVSMTTTRSRRTPSSAAVTRLTSGAPTMAIHPSAPSASAQMAMAIDQAPLPATPMLQPGGIPPQMKSDSNNDGTASKRSPVRVSGAICSIRARSSGGAPGSAILPVSNTCSILTTSDQDRNDSSVGTSTPGL